MFEDALRVCHGKKKVIVRTLIGIANYEAGKVTAAKEIFQQALDESPPHDPMPDYYIQLIEYADKKKSVMFPTNPSWAGRERLLRKQSPESRI